jgi:hypothetical protein
MKLGFGQIERALTEMHSVEASRAKGFRARLRYLQQKVDIGLPRGGGGRRANFTIGHAFLLALALELEQFGMSPERVAAVIGSLEVSDEEGTLRYALYEAADRVGTDRPAILLWFVPESLSDATRAADHKYDLSAATCSWCEAGALPENLFEQSSAVWRIAVINLSGLIQGLAEHLGCGEPTEYVDALMAWANDEEGE